MKDRLEVLEREHKEFFERWHDERRKNERIMEMMDISNSELLLMAGEMTAQELRTVRAVLKGLKARMLDNAERRGRSLCQHRQTDRREPCGNQENL